MCKLVTSAMLHGLSFDSKEPIVLNGQVTIPQHNNVTLIDDNFHFSFLKDNESLLCMFYCFDIK